MWEAQGAQEVLERQVQTEPVALEPDLQVSMQPCLAAILTFVPSVVLWEGMSSTSCNRRDHIADHRCRASFALVAPLLVALVVRELLIQALVVLVE